VIPDELDSCLHSNWLRALILLDSLTLPNEPMLLAANWTSVVSTQRRSSAAADSLPLSWRPVGLL
jgi:hypothetical protein